MILRCGHINCHAYIGKIEFPVLYAYLKVKCPKCGIMNELTFDREIRAGMIVECQGGE